MPKVFFISLALLLLPCLVLASNETSLENPLAGISSILQSSGYIGGVISRVLAIVGALALLMMVYGGLSMILAAGNETKITQGKNIVTYTAVGLIVIFISYSAITFFLKTLGGTIVDEFQDLPISADSCSGCVMPDGTRFCGLEGCDQSCSYCQTNNQDQFPAFDCSRCAGASAENGLEALCQIYCQS